MFEYMENVKHVMNLCRLKCRRMGKLGEDVVPELWISKHLGQQGPIAGSIGDTTPRKT
jgi:hypothetical protein